MTSVRLNCKEMQDLKSSVSNSFATPVRNDLGTISKVSRDPTPRNPRVLQEFGLPRIFENASAKRTPLTVSFIGRQPAVLKSNPQNHSNRQSLPTDVRPILRRLRQLSGSRLSLWAGIPLVFPWSTMGRKPRAEFLGRLTEQICGISAQIGKNRFAFHVRPG